MAYVLKLRHTGSPNVGGGEGPMVGDDVSYTISTTQDQTVFDDNGSGYVVRRLTPVECERLQGFPDGYTDISDYEVDGKRRKTTNTARYRSLGNSFCVPVIKWIGERMEMIEGLTRTEDQHARF